MSGSGSRSGSRPTRRICWPNPDATCLAGGCSHCEDHPPRTRTAIRKYAATAGVLPHRGAGEEEASAALRYGERFGDFYSSSGGGR